MTLQTPLSLLYFFNGVLHQYCHEGAMSTFADCRVWESINRVTVDREKICKNHILDNISELSMSFATFTIRWCSVSLKTHKPISLCSWFKGYTVVMWFSGQYYVKSHFLSIDTPAHYKWSVVCRQKPLFSPLPLILISSQDPLPLIILKASLQHCPNQYFTVDFHVILLF